MNDELQVIDDAIDLEVTSGNTIVNVIDDFVGATASSAGERGLVPKPMAGDQDHVLFGDGSWGVVTVADGGITTAKLATGAVTLAKLDSTLAASIPMSPLTNAEIDAITQ